MNPWDLSASDILVWGIVLHLVADWPLQNDWMARNKTSLAHPSAYVHAAIHGFALAWVFGWAAFPLALAHMLIDTRKPLEWWSKFIRQTQPLGRYVEVGRFGSHQAYIPAWDAGVEVRFWTDQVFHITCIAIAALLVT